MAHEKILVVDDEPTILRTLVRCLSSAGYEVQTAADGVSALDTSEHFTPDLVLTDLNMPNLDGLSLLQTFKERDARIPILLMTGSDRLAASSSTLPVGAADCLYKPLDMDVLLSSIARSLDGAPPRSATPRSKSESGVHQIWQLPGMIGASAQMRQIYQQVLQIAPSRATVLLTGESGTGKELVAAAIHQRSGRAAGPFIRVHCAALSEGVLESELFGHEQGSFTGATRQRPGRFEQANGGTLLLDEIGEISAAIQVKLLRVLQARELERVGGNDTLRVDVRVIAATNRDLKAMVSQGRFREDLYYRLNVINLRLPPLRERADDIVALLEHFLALFATESQKPARSFSDEALAALVRYSWPGNVREVQNVVQRAVVLADGEQIETSQLPPEITQASYREQLPSIPGATMLDFERYAILKTYEATGRSARQTAMALGMSVRKIQYRLQEYRREQTDGYAAQQLGGRPRRIGIRSRR